MEETVEKRRMWGTEEKGQDDSMVWHSPHTKVWSIGVEKDRSSSAVSLSASTYLYSSVLAAVSTFLIVF